MKLKGVRKGDVVTIYMPMIPQTAYVMLACARIGAVHSVVFAGFSADSLRDRINDCHSKFLFTADEVLLYILYSVMSLLLPSSYH